MMKKFLFVLVAVCGLMACEGDGVNRGSGAE